MILSQHALLASAPAGLKDATDLVHHVGLVKKSSIFGFKNNTLVDFLQIYVAQPRLVPTCKRILSEQGIPLNQFNPAGSQSRKFVPTYESNLPFALRMMVDLDIPGAGWVELPATKYKLRDATLVRIFKSP
jgi:DNA polymerase delta subunit 1